MERDKIDYEASIFGRYFLNVDANEEAKKLYREAMQRINQEGVDVKAVNFAVRHPRLLSYVDGGLAVIEPNSELRRRLYVMFAILESSPIYHEYFLPKRRPKLYIITIAAIGVVAIWKTFIGILIIKLIIK